MFTSIKKQTKILIRIVSRYYQRLVRSNSAYLIDGLYSIDISGKIVCHTSKTTENDASQFETFDKRTNSKKKGFLYRIRSGYRLKNSQGATSFSGSTMIISSSESELKFFDYHIDRILTIYGSADNYEKRIMADKMFSVFFHLPPVLSQDRERRIIVEKLIKVSINSELRDPLEYYFDAYIKYASNAVENGALKGAVASSWKETTDPYIRKLIQDVRESIPEMLDSSTFLLHGDYWRSNIICDGEQYYLIDWEWLGYYSITYDFFTYIFNEYTLFNNAHHKEVYFQGGYDAWLKRLFQIANVVYKPQFRRQYFELFVIELYFSRWTTCFSKIKKNVCKSISEMGITE